MCSQRPGSNEPIDAVITWVDGNDVAHQKKLADYLAKHQLSRPEAASPTRYNECGEIRYCVLSLLHFAPWLRTIYILTSGQTPAFLAELKDTPAENKVKVIDEHHIFLGFETNLPTFNSISIETLLWRIEGLADQFIYCNDDWFLIQAVKPEDFFREGKIVLRGHWKTQFQKKWRQRLGSLLGFASSKPDIYRTAQENAALLAGFKKRFFHLPHAPLAVNKQICKTFFDENPSYLQQNSQFAFRDHSQFLPFSLVLHLALLQNEALIDNHLKVAYFNPEAHSLAKINQRLLLADKDPNYAFVCAQSLDLAEVTVLRLFFDWLETKLARIESDV